MHSSTSVAIILAAVLVVLAFPPVHSQQPIQYGTIDFAIWSDNQCQSPWNNSEGASNGTYSYVDLSSNSCVNFNYTDLAGNVLPVAFQLNCSYLADIQHQYFYQNMWFNTTVCAGPALQFAHRGPVGACNALNITYNGTNTFNQTTIPSLYSQLICTVTGLPSSSSGASGPVGFSSGASAPVGLSSSTGTNAAIATATSNVIRLIVVALIAATAAILL